MEYFGFLFGEFIFQNDRLRFARCYMVLKRLVESAMKPYSIRSYWRMLTLWFRLGLYRFSRNHEADKGKNKGKKTGQNEITPGGGMTEICGFMKSSFN